MGWGALWKVAEWHGDRAGAPQRAEGRYLQHCCKGTRMESSSWEYFPNLQDKSRTVVCGGDHAGGHRAHGGQEHQQERHLVCTWLGCKDSAGRQCGLVPTVPDPGAGPGQAGGRSAVGVRDPHTHPSRCPVPISLRPRARTALIWNGVPYMRTPGLVQGRSGLVSGGGPSWWGSRGWSAY